MPSVGRPSYSVELERDISSLDSNLSIRSYLGRPLDSSAMGEEEQLSRQSQSLDEAFRLRRDSRISISGSFETPELEVPVSQFDIPRVERVKDREEAEMTERRAVSKMTELFLEEVRAKIQEKQQSGSHNTTHTHTTLTLSDTPMLLSSSLLSHSGIHHCGCSCIVLCFLWSQ